MKRFKTKASRGDTIIEVIIGIAVLGTVMAAAYISVTHSLQVGTDSGNRGQAGGFMQQQIETIKYAEQNDPAAISSYTDPANYGKPFCIGPPPGTARFDPGSSGSCSICLDNSQTIVGFADPVTGKCLLGELSSYTMNIVYNSKKIFTVTANWPAPNGSGKDEAVAYYKLPKVSLAPPPSCSNIPRDIALELDNSQSMSNPFITDPSGDIKLDVEKKAAHKLLNSLKIKLPGNHAAIIQFSGDAEVLTDLTSDTGALYNGVENIVQTPNNTDYSAALARATQTLSFTTPPRQKVLVLMSDGAPNGPLPISDAYAKAATLKSGGAIIYTVGIDVPVGGPEQAVMESIAGGIDSSGDIGRYYSVRDDVEFYNTLVPALAGDLTC